MGNSDRRVRCRALSTAGQQPGARAHLRQPSVRLPYPDARRLIAILGLDSDSYRRWRTVWMRNIELAEEYDREHFNRLMGFPDDLPSLHQTPPANTRPEGVQQSWYAKRQRGELPEAY